GGVRGGGDVVVYGFFFSSRRRHTRFSRDWSSDVCSSDLARELVISVKNSVTIDWDKKESVQAKMRVLIKRILKKYGYPPEKQDRSEERRVGKERKQRDSQSAQKKQNNTEDQNARDGTDAE